VKELKLRLRRSKKVQTGNKAQLHQRLFEKVSTGSNEVVTFAARPKVKQLAVKGRVAVPDGASVQGPPVCRTGRHGGGWGQTQTLKAAEVSFEHVRAVTTSWAEGSVVLHQGEKVEITREFPHGCTL
ncbi:unnamed protein product, partial [Symbiodinium sp. KB8]